MKKCIDTSKPHVNDESIECGCGITSTNCVITSEADSYLKILRGETVTNIIKIISAFLKKLNNKVVAITPTHKSYYAVVSQGSTNAPTELVVLENSLAAILTYSYFSVGEYHITSNLPIFDLDKTYLMCPSPSPQSVDIEVIVSTTTVLIIRTYDSSGTLADDLLSRAPITIKIEN